MKEQYFSKVELAEGDKESVVEILRVGRWDGSKGRFEITSQVLGELASSFQKRTYGTELQVNFSHNRWAEAAGWFNEVWTDGAKLYAKIEWTELGLDALKKKIYRYFSSEIAFEYKDEETQQVSTNVLMGGALTNIPYIRGLAPVMFSEEVGTELTNQKPMDKQKLDEETVEKTEETTTTEVEETTETEKEDVAPEKVEAHDSKTLTLAEAKELAKKEVEKATQKYVERMGQLENTMLSKELDEKLKDFELADNGTVAVGFAKNAISEVKAFATILSKEQREKFFSILGNMKSVDFSEYGATAEGEKLPKLSFKRTLRWMKNPHFLTNAQRRT
jgi:hypothetical protein